MRDAHPTLAPRSGFVQQRAQRRLAQASLRAACARGLARSLGITGIAVDADTIKSVVSVVAAIVAVASAVLAHRAKVQTRRDLFDAERNSLVLIMAENDARCEHIALQEAFAREELARIEPHLTSPNVKEEHAEWLKRIPSAAELSRGIGLREYTPERLDALEYTEPGLTILRQMTRGEQVNSKLLVSASYDLIFSGISAFVARHDE